MLTSVERKQAAETPAREYPWTQDSVQIGQPRNTSTVRRIEIRYAGRDIMLGV